MKIKKYFEFINENSLNIKSDLINFFESQKSEIEAKGLDFTELRDNFVKSIESLDEIFLEKISNDLSQCDVSDKHEFEMTFNKVLQEIATELQKTHSLTESFFSSISSIWSEVKKAISHAAKWISDRLLSITGIITMGLAGVLFIISQWGGGLSMPSEFANVIVNTVLMIGVAIFKYGQKVDEYKNISEI